LRRNRPSSTGRAEQIIIRQRPAGRFFNVKTRQWQAGGFFVCHWRRRSLQQRIIQCIFRSKLLFASMPGFFALAMPTAVSRFDALAIRCAYLRRRCSAGRSIVAPENPPTPISCRLARASRSGSYWSVMTRMGGACMPASRAQPASVQITRHGLKPPRASSEALPDAAGIRREIKFLTVNGGFKPY
jgi:hypothetical protein